MAPSEFYVRLQHGITGGFAPPTPSAVFILSASADQPSKLTIDSQIRPTGTPSLQSAGPKSLALESGSSTDALVDELEGILKSIPVESPPGSEDIYGLDTSIMWGSNEFQWSNGGPQGCVGGQSEVQATEEDKKKFNRAVEIVKTLVDQAA